jgi:hypothetical protein
MKYKWQNSNIILFEDDIGTIYEKGPFVIDGNTYDYKLTDNNGVDYCSEEQMVVWKVNFKKDLNMNTDVKYIPETGDFIIEGTSINEKSLTEQEKERFKKIAKNAQFLVDKSEDKSNLLM